MGALCPQAPTGRSGQCKVLFLRGVLMQLLGHPMEDLGPLKPRGAVHILVRMAAMGRGDTEFLQEAEQQGRMEVLSRAMEMLTVEGVPGMGMELGLGLARQATAPVGQGTVLGELATMEQRTGLEPMAELRLGMALATVGAMVLADKAPAPAGMAMDTGQEPGAMGEHPPLPGVSVLGVTVLGRGLTVLLELVRTAQGSRGAMEPGSMEVMEWGHPEPVVGLLWTPRTLHRSGNKCACCWIMPRRPRKPTRRSSRQ
mmetsp:Transcript_40589/g.63385  ORF Transcript_40589/g.63385 Transcript_40589/m.63385 type:complete len:256 (+) Transcript_40589:1290-2057(+)